MAHLSIIVSIIFAISPHNHFSQFPPNAYVYVLGLGTSYIIYMHVKVGLV